MLMLLACAGPQAFVPAPENHFFPQTWEEKPYQVYLPADWSADRTWPVVMYLHGGGERGTDGVKQTQVGLGPVIHASNGSFPYIVAFPQSPRAFWAMPQGEQEVLAVLDDVIARYHGDPERVVLTGNSMGGYGTWIIGAKNPSRFAVLMPICGGILPPKGFPIPADAPFLHEPDPYQAVAQAIGKTPVWAFHGADDPMVNPDNSRKLVAALKQAGGDVRYTEYPGVGHESEKEAYVEPELLSWLAEKLK